MNEIKQMKRHIQVLIYLNKNSLAPQGGPSGVGFYLKQEIDRREIDYIDFINSKENTPSNIKKITSKFPGYLYLSKIRTALKYNKMLRLPKSSVERKLLFSKYDIIHFHTTFSMYECRKDLEDYKGYILLSSHSPIPLAQEKMSEISTFEKILFSRVYDRLYKMDYYAFRRADYIVFPCPEAEESYLRNWKEYEEIKKIKDGKFRYAITGIVKAIPNKSKKEVRLEISIPEDAFVVSFVGRHNMVKGYDNLKKIGEKTLKKHDNLYFLIAGKEGPFSRLEHSRWKEVGWTSDPYSYINAADVFILPNKETYFDIVMLEVMSLGKVVIASRTGGNKYYEKMNVKGVFLYDTINEAELLLENIYALDEKTIRELGDANKAFFDENLTVKNFMNQYLEIISEIGSNKFIC